MSVIVFGEEFPVGKESRFLRTISQMGSYPIPEYENCLEIQKKGITDFGEIEGLQELTDLQALILNDNQITEIKNLESLTSLRILILYRNRVTEIKDLDSLTELKFLDLGGNQITEIKGLDSLVNLQFLSLGGNQITEMKGLENLGNLSKLSLSLNPISDWADNKFGIINYESHGQKFPWGFLKDAQAAVSYCRTNLGLESELVMRE